MCPSCNGTGYRTVEVPVFRDGGYSDVDQIEARCACNPDPTDADYPDFDVPFVDFDPAFRDSKYEGI